jgi:hypothetical protein
MSVLTLLKRTVRQGTHVPHTDFAVPLSTPKLAIRRYCFNHEACIRSLLSFRHLGGWVRPRPCR